MNPKTENQLEDDISVLDQPSNDGLETGVQIQAAPTDERSHMLRSLRLRGVPTRRIWLILIGFLFILGLIAAGIVYSISKQNRGVQSSAYATQSLSAAAQDHLKAVSSQPEDYLMGGRLYVGGSLNVNTITSAADMLVGSQTHALTLQGSGLSLSTSAGQWTNTLRFAPPSGNSKSIIMPDASGTVAVSASGSLALDANGNLTCPSCGALASGSGTATTNNYTSTTVNMVSLASGLGITIDNSNGTQTISTAYRANTALSNLSSVAINADLLPGSDNTIDIGSSTTAFRSGYYSTSVNSPSFDTATAGALSIGATNASSISLGANTTITAGKSLTANGNALFQAAINSTTAFSVQQASGTSIFNVDTVNGRIGIGNATPANKLSINALTTADATSQLAIGTGAAGNKGLIVQGVSGQTADLMQAQSSTGTVLASVGATGMATFKNTTDSSTAFQIQDSSGTALLNADTKQGTVSVGVYNPTIVWSTATVATTSYPTGTQPRSITTGDFNGDGKPDIAVTNQYSNTISVFMNNGNGTFAPKVDYYTGALPLSITSADFNGDGHPDLATVNAQDNTVSVFINNGNGTFATGVIYATGVYPSSITTADFNGDGHPDLAVANQNGDSVSVLLNNGNGTFASKSDYAAATGAALSITTADLNGDGKTDLAVTTSGGYISTFINNGGTFAPKVDYTAGSYPTGVTSADFNGDGRIDLATANNSGNNISVLLFGSTPVGTPVAQASSELTVNSEAGKVVQLIQGTAGQTADLLQVQDNIDNTLFSVGATGNVAIAGNATTAGTLKVTGTVTASGALNVAGSLSASGALYVSGALNATTLNATGAALFKNISNSTGAFQIQNSSGVNLFTADTTNSQIIVTKLVVNTAITINGHIISGGTVPTIVAGTAACTAPTVSIAGTDTAGLITVTTGSACGTVGKLATISFAAAFGAAPRVSLTSGNALSASLQSYIDSSTIGTTSFDLDTATAPASGTAYQWFYEVIQ